VSREGYRHDPDLTGEQQQLVDDLSESEVYEIDQALFAKTSQTWRKVARVVGTTIVEAPDRAERIPDIYYSQRIRHLVKQGLLEAQGDLTSMRYCEVRQPR